MNKYLISSNKFYQEEYFIFYGVFLTPVTMKKEIKEHNRKAFLRIANNEPEIFYDFIVVYQFTNRAFRMFIPF